MSGSSKTIQGILLFELSYNESHDNKGVLGA